MKKTLILLFSFLFIFASTFPVKASEIQSINSTNIIEIFDDGSYIESSTEENIIATLSRSSSTKSAKRTYTYKASSGKILWTITVTGTFTYNGSSSSCTKASVSTTCPSITFKLASKSTTKHNSTATATASFKQYNDSVYLRTITRSVSISCDKSGKLK